MCSLEAAWSIYKDLSTDTAALNNFFVLGSETLFIFYFC